MLYKRYGNPLDLLRTFTLEGLTDFIFYLFDQENEDTLFTIWLHKDQESDFATFKKKNGKKTHKQKPKSLTKEEEEKIIKASFQFITPRQKGGD
ncbi:hypothetical protein RVS70_09465 [Virgibacillus sp. M23]|uniref:hypothetical protein n=1 Tax=Virgibacillus sp. M23 TaxID=3079030 RepID=UPI002A90D476|nr:hypothetical protein [Virgibacillus sp. M23]MDY7044432.1 hypothetical protein [Virgibacillus sp. M23]